MAGRLRAFLGGPDVLARFSWLFQVVVVAALFVQWRLMNIPLAAAGERCVVVGGTAYAGLAALSAVQRAVARFDPWAFVARRLGRLASFSTYGIMRYAYDENFLRSAGVCAAIWATSSIVMRRIERWGRV